jgi:hypothetical protein
LRACARDYGEASEAHTIDLNATVLADRALQKAAVLFVYEALKVCDNAMIKEWPHFDEMLKSLAMLLGDLP